MDRDAVRRVCDEVTAKGAVGASWAAKGAVGASWAGKATAIALVVPDLLDELEAAERERDQIRADVQRHHDQVGDDRCHLDDTKLYHDALGEGVDPYVGALPPDGDMEESCRRYIRQRRCPGPEGVLPLPGNMTIAQLTAEVERLRSVERERDELRRLIGEAPRLETAVPPWFQRLWESCVTLAEKAEFKHLWRHLEALETRCREAEEILATVPRIADKTFDYWDNDMDAKVGKWLSALAGRLQGYHPDTTRIHEHLAKIKGYRDAQTTASAEVETDRRRPDPTRPGPVPA